MNNQNDYEFNENAEQYLEQDIDLNKVKYVGRNVPENKRWSREEWNEIMDDNSERDQRDKYSETFEKIDENIHDMIEKVSTNLKKMDSIKILQKMVEEIKPKIDEIKILSGSAQTILEECKKRELDAPIIDSLKKEIDDFEKLNSLDLEQTIKQLIGKKTIEIGKIAFKGMGKLGLNMIGSSVLGVGKIIKGVKNLGEGTIKFKDKDSQIKQKKEKYYIDFGEEKEEQDEIVKSSNSGQDIRFADYRYYADDIYDYSKDKNSEIDNSEFYKDMRMSSHSKKDYVENVDKAENKDDYEEYTKKTKKDNFVKRTIKGVKDFRDEVGKKFKWVKDREARQAFKNKQKEKFANLRRNVAQKIRSTNAYKSAETNYNIARAVAAGVKEEIESIPGRVSETWNQVKSEASEVKEDIVKEVKDIPNKAKSAYEQAKDKFNMRKNDNLIKVLKAGENFSQDLLKRIENGIKTREEKNKAINEKNTIKRQNVKEDNIIDYQ